MLLVPLAAGAETFRVVAANLNTTQAEGTTAAGQRLLQGLKPDIVLVQGFYAGEIGNPAFVRQTFPEWTTPYLYMVANTAPQNGILTRFPILNFERGAIDHTFDFSRAAGWARLRLPNDVSLLAFSIALSESAQERVFEVESLLPEIRLVQARFPGSYTLIGGVTGADSLDDPTIARLAEVADLLAPAANDGSTSATATLTNVLRTRQMNAILPAPELVEYQRDTIVGAQFFPTGLVFDSRFYSPLADVAPIQPGDSASGRIEELLVVRDFELPTGPAPSPTPTPSPSPTASPTPTESPTPTASPSQTATPTASPSATATPTATPSATPSPSPSPSPTLRPVLDDILNRLLGRPATPVDSNADGVWDAADVRRAQL